jgi:myosin heavy subunit
LVDLEFLTEPEILDTLRKRFVEKKIIHTFIGNSLLIFNPYERNEDLYCFERIMEYYNRIVNLKEEEENGNEKVAEEGVRSLEPHVFSFAALAYR